MKIKLARNQDFAATKTWVFLYFSQEIWLFFLIVIIYFVTIRNTLLSNVINVYQYGLNSVLFSSRLDL